MALAQVSTRDKQAISQTLINAWRRQTETVHFGEHTGYVLDLNSWPVDCLPELSADFAHISALHLSHSPNGKFPGTFLQKFVNLRVLALKNNQLGELPGEIAGMSELVDLNLQGQSDCFERSNCLGPVGADQTQIVELDRQYPGQANIGGAHG